IFLQTVAVAVHAGADRTPVAAAHAARAAQEEAWRVDAPRSEEAPPVESQGDDHAAAQGHVGGRFGLQTVVAVAVRGEGAGAEQRAAIAPCEGQASPPRGIA